MLYEVHPEPDEDEREALETALREEDSRAARPYASRWRESGRGLDDDGDR